MIFNIKIFTEALQDITDASDWYERQSSGLGSKFKNSPIAQIRKLTEHAELYIIRYDDVRCVLIKKFPFMVHYRIEASSREVQIFAIHHTSLSPDIWKSRGH